jgi:hypothetical protein
MRFADDPEVLALLRRERKWEVDMRRAKMRQRETLRAICATLLCAAALWAVIIWAVMKWR